MPTPKWTAERLSADAFQISFPVRNSGDERWVLLMSDEHWDNQHCDLALLKRHHEEALERDAPILKFGDLFCAMQGKWDKRSDQNQLRPEHRGNNYLDLLVTSAAKFYQPFSSHIAVISPGNHELSIAQRHQTDLIERLCDRLGPQTMHAAYTGFIRFRMFREIAGGKASALCRDLHYHHGYGGGGEVTRGLIDNSRTRGQYIADIYYSGHIHRRNHDENIVQYLDASGNVAQREQLFLRGGAYKHDEDCTWHKTQGRGARPLGGWWLKFTYHRSVKGDTVLVDAIPAR